MNHTRPIVIKENAITLERGKSLMILLSDERFNRNKMPKVIKIIPKNIVNLNKSI